jgi:hypothetical protein
MGTLNDLQLAISVVARRRLNDDLLGVLKQLLGFIVVLFFAFLEGLFPNEISPTKG